MMNHKTGLTWGSQPWSADRRREFAGIDCLEPSPTGSILRLLELAFSHYSILQYYWLSSKVSNNLMVCTRATY